MSTECIQCGDSWNRERMLSLNLGKPEEERPEPDELVCLRCAIVALKGGPLQLNKEQREKYRVKA